MSQNQIPETQTLETQFNISSEVQVRIRVKKPTVQAKFIEVPKYVYNTIRSFIESSSKSGYPWNTGVMLNGKIIFQKYGKWKLVVHLKPEQSCIVTLFSGTIPILCLALDESKPRLKLNIYTETIQFESIGTYYVISRERVPFEVPIPLTEVLEKLKEYVDVDVSR